jgi:hypothetical protein
MGYPPVEQLAAILVTSEVFILLETAQLHEELCRAHESGIK